MRLPHVHASYSPPRHRSSVPGVIDLELLLLLPLPLLGECREWLDVWAAMRSWFCSIFDITSPIRVLDSERGTWRTLGGEGRGGQRRWGGGAG